MMFEKQFAGIKPTPANHSKVYFRAAEIGVIEQRMPL
jgi:hypothetical protein